MSPIIAFFLFLCMASAALCPIIAVYFAIRKNPKWKYFFTGMFASFFLFFLILSIFPSEYQSTTSTQKETATNNISTSNKLDSSISNKQKEAFSIWQKDFKNYSSALPDYTKKLNKIIAMTNNGTIDSRQAISNLNDLENKFLGFNLLIHDKWQVPNELDEKYKEQLQQSIYAFEDCLSSYKDATGELRNLIINNLPLNDPNFEASINFAKQSYQKSYDIQKKVEDELK